MLWTVVPVVFLMLGLVHGMSALYACSGVVGSGLSLPSGTVASSLVSDVGLGHSIGVGSLGE